MTLAIDKGFLKDLGKLEKSVYNRVAEVFGEFDASTHTGLHLEKVTNVRNPRFGSIRIDQAWRGIVLTPVTGDVYTLLKVLHHDDAHAWARRHPAPAQRPTGQQPTERFVVTKRRWVHGCGPFIASRYLVLRDAVDTCQRVRQLLTCDLGVVMGLHVNEEHVGQAKRSR